MNSPVYSTPKTTKESLILSFDNLSLSTDQIHIGTDFSLISSSNYYYDPLTGHLMLRGSSRQDGTRRRDRKVKAEHIWTSTSRYVAPPLRDENYGKMRKVVVGLEGMKITVVNDKFV